jgi:hypothetical protein
MLIASVGLISCSDKPATNDYFPLQKGLSWQYRYQLTTSAKQEQGLYTVTNLGATEVGNETLTIRRTSTDRDYYLMQKPDGIYRYASRTLFETHPVVDEPARLVLPMPYLGSTERTWSSTTTSYVIHRTGPSTIASANATKDFVMNYRIASKDETVIVPAGKFEHCLLVEGDATLTLFADPMTGYTDIPVKTREWYAPGVGMVKLERTEPLETSVYKGGRYVFELISN